MRKILGKFVRFMHFYFDPERLEIQPVRLDVVRPRSTALDRYLSCRR